MLINAFERDEKALKFAESFNVPVPFSFPERERKIVSFFFLVHS